EALRVAAQHGGCRRLLRVERADPLLVGVAARSCEDFHADSIPLPGDGGSPAPCPAAGRLAFQVDRSPETAHIKIKRDRIPSEGRLAMKSRRLVVFPTIIVALSTASA